MKVLLIGATHGNETLGVELYQSLLSSKSGLLENIEFVIGNPRAYARNVRYIDEDLNRSHQTHGATYESMRAAYLQSYVAQVKPDIVIDIHTTSCEQPTCLIVRQTSSSTIQRYLAASSIPRVILMPSLSDSTTLAQNVVGYEVSRNESVKTAIEVITNDIERFITGIRIASTKSQYSIVGKIEKKDTSLDELKSMKNFEQCKSGFVPFLVGDNSYRQQTDYYGFKMNALGTVTII